DDGEPVRRELRVQRLPDRQVVAAPSPGGEREQEDLAAAEVAERARRAREIREREVGSVERLEAARALVRRCPHHRDALVEIDGERPAQNVGDAREVDAVGGRQLAVVAHGEAEIADADALGLDARAERRRERVRSDADDRRDRSSGTRPDDGTAATTTAPSGAALGRSSDVSFALRARYVRKNGTA